MGARRRRRGRQPLPRRVRRWVRRQDRFTRRLLFAVTALGLFVLALSILPALNPPRREAGGRGARPVARAPERAAPRTRAPAPARTASRRPAPPAVARRAAPAPPAPIPAPPPVVSPAPGGAAAAAIVIDDLGRSIAHIRQISDLGMPLTVAVLPGLPATESTVRVAKDLGIETLLHLPMEPLEADRDPGPGALRTRMAPAEVLRLLRSHLAAVPGAVGVNNHMGSLFTADAAALGPVFQELKARGLFWLDSRTSAASRGGEAARAHGVPAAERDVFLDAEVAPEFIRGQLRRLVRIAKRRGLAVGIGHPHPETLAALREMHPELRASGVEWVPLSELVRRVAARSAPLLSRAPAGGAAGAGTP